MTTIEQLTLLQETRQLIEEAEAPYAHQIAAIEKTKNSNQELAALKTKASQLEVSIRKAALVAEVKP